MSEVEKAKLEVERLEAQFALATYRLNRAKAELKAALAAYKASKKAK